MNYKRLVMAMGLFSTLKSLGCLKGALDLKGRIVQLHKSGLINDEERDLIIENADELVYQNLTYLCAR